MSFVDPQTGQQKASMIDVLIAHENRLNALEATIQSLQQQINDLDDSAYHHGIAFEIMGYRLHHDVVSVDQLVKVTSNHEREDIVHAMRHLVGMFPEFLGLIQAEQGY